MLLAVLLSIGSYGQLLNEQEFSLSSAVRPGSARKMVKLDDNDFIAFSKIKGGISGKADYVLERHSKILEKKWGVEISFEDVHSFHSFLIKDNRIILLIESADTKNKVAQLEAWSYDVKNGAELSKTVIHKVSVGEWKAQFGKAGAKETFENALGASVNEGAVTPVQYQFQVEYSPNKKKVLSYIFDYSQTNLIANAKIMDTQFQKLDSGIVPIDNGYLNYGIGINDNNEVFILNSNRGGKIVVVKYHLSTRENQLLDIQTASSKRDNLKMKIIRDDIVYVVNLNKRNGVLLGVTYAKFNFATNLIDKVHFHELSQSLKSSVEASQKTMKMSFEDDWTNYDITDFHINQFEKIVIVLEKRFLKMGEYPYNPDAQNDIETWQLRAGSSITGNMLIFSFNAADALMWENYIVKYQESMLNFGLTNSSHYVDFGLDDRIRILHSAIGKGGALNDIRYVEIDAATGNKHKNISLPNDNKLTYIRDYTVWFDNFDEEMDYLGSQLVLVGKKGFTGKKTYVNLFKL